MTTEEEKVLQLGQLVIDWHTDVLEQINKMTDSKIKSIDANTDGKITTLLSEPQRVRDAQLGMLLVGQLIKNCPITIEKEDSNVS